jgi:competence protein ComGC
MEIRFTNKQIEILNAIKKGRSDGTECSVYDVQDALSYEVKRDALLHSIKILVDTGYIERRDRVIRDGKSLRVFRVTTKATEVI